MKKHITELLKKPAAELLKTVQTTRVEISKLVLERKTAPQKDSNTLSKKRRMLAQVLTVMQTQKAVAK